MPRVEVSSTCGGSTPGAVSVSVPVVSAWIHFSLGRRLDQVVRDVMAEPDDDVEIGRHRLGLGAVLEGVEGDVGKARAASRVAVLLRVVVENENLCRHEGS